MNKSKEAECDEIIEIYNYFGNNDNMKYGKNNPEVNAILTRDYRVAELDGWLYHPTNKTT